MFIFRPLTRTLVANHQIAYIFGGEASGGSVSNAIQSFSSAFQTAETTGIFLTPSASYSSAATLNNTAWIFGGYNGSTLSQTFIRSFDRFSCTLSATASLYFPDGVQGASAVALDESAYIFGGQQLNIGYISSVRRFNVSSNVSLATSLAANRAFQSSAGLSGAAYIFGGFNGSVNTNTIYKHTGTVASTETATLSAPNAYSSSATLDAASFIFGGNASTTAIQRFDGTSRTTDAATLPSSNFGSTAVSDGSKLYVFAGENTYSTTIKSYDGTTCSTLSTTLIVPRRYASASVINAGTINS